MMGRAAEAAEGLFQEPVFIFCITRIAGGQTDNGKFIFWECCIAEGILRVTLLQHRGGVNR
jgi:hypothetical protein